MIQNVDQWTNDLDLAGADERRRRGEFLGSDSIPIMGQFGRLGDWRLAQYINVIAIDGDIDLVIFGQGNIVIGLIRSLVDGQMITAFQ